MIPFTSTLKRVPPFHLGSSRLNDVVGASRRAAVSGFTAAGGCMGKYCRDLTPPRDCETNTQTLSHNLPFDFSEIFQLEHKGKGAAAPPVTSSFLCNCY